MRLATRTAILVVLLTATGAQAETRNPKPNNKPAETTAAFRGRSLQTETLQDVATRPATNAASKSFAADVPQFGFESSFGWQNSALGERVTGVQFGGLASRLELKPGDTIVGVNGQELRTADGWQNAIQRAAEQDGWVTLKVLDGRSGRMAYRTANLLQLNDR